MRPRCLFALSLWLALVAPAVCAADRNVDKVNGSITVEAGGRYGNLETVNGGINIGADARVADAEAVTGTTAVRYDGARPPAR